MKRWLVSSFAPFGGAETNSSALVLNNLRNRSWDGQVEFTEPLPVSFADAWPELRSKIHSGIDGVLALGQAETRLQVTPERIAANWIEARIADNLGYQPRSAKIRDSGPDSLVSNIPWDKLELPSGCALSTSAGQFVCNQLLYKIVEWCQANTKLGGFIHIPRLTSQTEPLFSALPCMDDAQATSIVDLLIRQLVQL